MKCPSCKSENIQKTKSTMLYEKEHGCGNVYQERVYFCKDCGTTFIKVPKG